MVDHLYEKFVLLALDQKKGRFVIDALALNYGIAGAILLELSEMKKIKLQNKKISIDESKYTKNLILDECMKLISEAKNPRKARFWISKIGNKSSRFKKMILKDLVHKNILRIEMKTAFFRLIKYNRYPALNNNLIDELKTKVRKTVIEKNKSDIEGLLLLSLINSCKLIRTIFLDKNEYRSVNKQIKELIKDIEISDIVSQTLKEIQSAMVAATVTTYVGTT